MDNDDNKSKEKEKYLPKWLVITLGSLLILFVALLVVQKGNDLKNAFKNQKPTNTITLSADGKITATPDLATVTIGVTVQGATAQEVKDSNNQKINQVTNFIKQQGIDDKDITTSEFYLNPQQDWSSGTQKIIGYQGNETVTVKVHGIDKDQTKLETILDGSVNNGANEIQGIQFGFNDPEFLQQQAQKQAIDNAKKKAQDLAQEAGLNLGKVVSISETNSNIPGPMPYAMVSPSNVDGALEKPVTPDINPGSQDITESMTVTFEIK